MTTARRLDDVELVEESLAILIMIIVIITIEVVVVVVVVGAVARLQPHPLSPSIVDIFYSFSRFCEIGISLLRL